MAVSKITAVGQSPTKTVVDVRGFQLTIDQPPYFGGKDEGPTPVEFVLAALAGCLNMMGHMIAREMGFELRGLRFEAEGDLNPARLMGKSDQTRAGFEEITVRILPDTDADPDLLKEWVLRVEDRCPVTDNLANKTPISLTLG